MPISKRSIIDQLAIVEMIRKNNCYIPLHYFIRILQTDLAAQLVELIDDDNVEREMVLSTFPNRKLDEVAVDNGTDEESDQSSRTWEESRRTEGHGL